MTTLHCIALESSTSCLWVPVLSRIGIDNSRPSTYTRTQKHIAVYIVYTSMFIAFLTCELSIRLSRIRYWVHVWYVKCYFSLTRTSTQRLKCVRKTAECRCFTGTRTHAHSGCWLWLALMATAVFLLSSWWCVVDGWMREFSFELLHLSKCSKYIPTTTGELFAFAHSLIHSFV